MLTALCILIAPQLSAGKLYALPLYVDYYGVVSESSETNILKMAQDIFLTQLKSIANISVDDKRVSPNETLREKPDLTQTTEPHQAFYAEIAEAEESGSTKSWLCTFTLVKAGATVKSKSEHYDSYYKILTNAKAAIESVFEETVQQHADTKTANQSHGSMNITALAGNWQGEPSVDKIILLRGGKGFVIYKNGASMNVKVAVTKTDSAGNILDIEITQDSKGNASFFPQLPRETALAIAANAPPIVWNLHASGDGMLTGTKRTLIPSRTAPRGVVEGTERIQWIKK